MAFYFSGAIAYGTFLTYRMSQDPECSNTDLTSWTIIAIASLFWIVVIPISVIELKTKAQANLKEKHIDRAQSIKNETESTNSPLADY